MPNGSLYEYKNCTCRNFSEAVFDLFNCETIQLEGSFFEDNSGTGVLFETFRGNTGAVALGYNYYPHNLNQPYVSITNCEFINNSARGAASNILSSERTLSNNVFTGRGGGIGLYIGEASNNVTLEMIDSKVIGNYGHLFGGGIYIAIISPGTQLLLIFERIDIIGNRAGSGGGGVQLSYLSVTDIQKVYHTVAFRKCNFVENVGDSGGGIYVFTSFIGKYILNLK